MRALLVGLVVTLFTYFPIAHVGLKWVQADESARDGPIRTGFPFEDQSRSYNDMTGQVHERVDAFERAKNRSVYGLLALAAGGLAWGVTRYLGRSLDEDEAEEEAPVS